MTTNGSLV